MKPNWDALGEDYENSKKVIIADVDCTLDKNKQLCENEGIKGYPTLKYYPPLEKEGIIYEGERTLEALRNFAKTLGPVCGPKFPKRCSDDEKVVLDTYMAMEVATLATELEAKQSLLDDAETKHQELMKQLQAQFQASSNALEAQKAELGPAIRMVKAVLKEKESSPDAEPAEAAEAVKAEL